MKKETLINKLNSLEISKYGFCNLTGALPDKLSHLPYGISFMIKLSDAVLDQITDKPTFTYFQHYRAVNTLINQEALKLSMFIEKLGFNAFPVPASQTVNDSKDEYSAIFQHKTAAVLSGLGWIGKSALFISEEYGPRVRLGTVLTDMELCETNNILTSKCGNCNICVDACPAMAITGKNWVPGCERSTIFDAGACSEYMNTHFKHIGRGSVCGICVKVCPYGKKL